MRPSRAVLASFGAGTGADNAPVPLPGRQGTTWPAGPPARRPGGDPQVARWAAGLSLALSGHTDPAFRVPRPVRCRPAGRLARDEPGDGWVARDQAAGAWVAWQWLPGETADWAGR